MISEQQGILVRRKSSVEPLIDMLTEKVDSFFSTSVMGVDVGSSLVQGGCFSIKYEPYKSWYPRLALRKRVLGKDQLCDAKCYVIYFPDLWHKDPMAMLKMVKQHVALDGVLMVVMLTDDLSGQDMCQLGDDLHKELNMTCVMDRHPYTGGLDFVDSEKEYVFMIAQLWGGSQISVSLDQLKTYFK